MKDYSSFESCLKKQAAIESLFKECASPDEKYQQIISLGRSLEFYPQELKIKEKIVPGCQSVMYLHAFLEQEKMRFLASSDALISAGLASLLIMAFDRESPDVVLKCPPHFLEKIGIQGTLSPSRSNGLASLFLKMKQESLLFCVKF